MATDHNFRIKNGLEVGGQLIVNSSGQLVVADISANQKFLDNVRLRFGNSSDLQIWHNGTDSYVMDSGDGDLRLLGSSNVRIQNQGDNADMIVATSGGAATLYHSGSPRLATTSSGIAIPNSGNTIGWATLANAGVLIGSTSAGIGIDNNEIMAKGVGNLYFGTSDASDVIFRAGGTAARLTIHDGGDVEVHNSLDVGADLNVTGDLNITGDINSVSVTDLDVADKTITVANNAGSSSNADGAGIIVDTGGTLPSILWDHANQRFNFSYKANFAGTPTVNGVDVLTTNAGINANNINAGTISSARLPTNINADTLDNLNSTEFLRSNATTYYAAGSVGFDLHGGPLASQTMNSHHGLSNNGSISDFFMYIIVLRCRSPSGAVGRSPALARFLYILIN